VQATITKARLERHVGQVLPVLVEGEASRGESRLCGRAPGNEMVNFASAPGAIPGAIVDVAITARRAHTLFGELRGTRELPQALAQGPTAVRPAPRRLPVIAS
jgi:tRNA A37 methylthiotransferase MiaB